MTLIFYLIFTYLFAMILICCSAWRLIARFLLLFVLASLTLPTASSWGMNAPPQIPMLPPGSPSAQGIHHNLQSSPPHDHEFTLRHLFHYGTQARSNPDRWIDVHPDDEIWIMAGGQNHIRLNAPLHTRSRQMEIQRLSDRRLVSIKSLIQNGSSPTLAPSWSLDELYGPDIKEKETIISLATMASNAYVKVPETEDWKDVVGGLNETSPFGWKGNGLRGHIFADQDNSTIIVAIKGTSFALFDGAETATSDKENDNLFFGCCCGAGGHILWRTVCECSTSAFTCDQTCIVKALRTENRYYQAALNLYANVTDLYPNSQIWMTGHSLGGAVSSLLGLTFGLPVVTFEAPGDALAAARLGLPAPPNSHPSAPQSRKNTGIYHIGHTADPVFMGTCNSVMSACTLGGYSMESECHTGKVCVYDTVKDKGWRVGIGYHQIVSVIEDVIKAYDTVAPCVSDSECVDCFNWKFFDSNGTSPTTSRTRSSTTTLTRTTTCHTPGWWGCLDEPTPTSAGTITTSTSSRTKTTTSTCHTPGWFGCLDPDDPITTSTSICSSYGWFGGCIDDTITSSTSTCSSDGLPGDCNDDTLTTSTPVVSCHKYGWFGGCLDKIKSPLTSATCLTHGWFGVCLDKKKPSLTSATCLEYGWFGRCVAFATQAAAVKLLPITTTSSVSFSSGIIMVPSPASYAKSIATATNTNSP